jgi:hypothetical protein
MDALPLLVPGREAFDVRERFTGAVIEFEGLGNLEGDCIALLRVDETSAGALAEGLSDWLLPDAGFRRERVLVGAVDIAMVVAVF